MTSAKFLWALRDFVPEYYYAKFGCNWTTNKGETEGKQCAPSPAYMVPKDPSLNRVKGELQRENKLISYERVSKMLESDTYITGIGQAILQLFSFEVGSRNHQKGISLLQKFSEILVIRSSFLSKMASHLISYNFQTLKIEILSKPCRV